MFRQLQIRRARVSPAAFAALALRDEQTGQPVRLARHHREMYGLWSSCKRSVTYAPSETGKSASLACWIAWRLGCDPSLRIGILSGTTAQAERQLRHVGIVLGSPGFAEVFPGVHITRQTATELELSTKPATTKDANLVAAAFDLSSLQGTRLDIAACDDIVSRESVRTPIARDRAYSDFVAVTSSRIAPSGEIHVVNTAEHTDDVPHRLSKLPGWTTRSFPALDDAGNPTWPERWPIERIEARRLELGPVGFQRAMMCCPIDEASIVFSQDMLDVFTRNGQQAHFSPLGGRTVIGVDPAWTTTATSDESGIVVVTIDDSGFRHVVHIEALRVRHDALVSRVVHLAQANRAVVYVESNGAGGIIADMIGRRVPVKKLVTTATSKTARVEALAAELAAGRWALRQVTGIVNEQQKKLLADLATFSFESHCGDRLSAMLLACEGVRTLEARRRVGFFRLDLVTR